MKQLKYDPAVALATSLFSAMTVLWISLMSAAPGRGDFRGNRSVLGDRIIVSMMTFDQVAALRP